MEKIGCNFIFIICFLSIFLFCPSFEAYAKCEQLDPPLNEACEGIITALKILDPANKYSKNCKHAQKTRQIACESLIQGYKKSLRSYQDIIAKVTFLEGQEISNSKTLPWHKKIEERFLLIQNNSDDPFTEAYRYYLEKYVNKE